MTNAQFVHKCRKFYSVVEEYYVDSGYAYGDADGAPHVLRDAIVKLMDALAQIPEAAEAEEAVYAAWAEGDESEEAEILEKIFRKKFNIQ